MKEEALSRVLEVLDSLIRPEGPKYLLVRGSLGEPEQPLPENWTGPDRGPARSWTITTGASPGLAATIVDKGKLLGLPELGRWNDLRSGFCGVRCAGSC